MLARCPVCTRMADCRPYGAGGSLICFDCMTSDPEREAEAKRQFVARLAEARAVSPVVYIDAEGGLGPQPVGGPRQ